MRRTKTNRLPKAGIERADLYEFFCADHIHHVSNDEYYGRPFDLEAWQRDNIWRPVFACGRYVDGSWRRRFRRALIGLPRGYGKSEIACAMLLTIANMEPIRNGQYGLVASSEEQAGNLLKKLKTMIALDPDLKALWEPLKKTIVNRETGAEIMVFPYSEASMQSWHFNVVIADELHVWRDSTVWDAIVSGQKIIPNALAIAITTAGQEQGGFLWEWLEDSERDDACYTYWLGADVKDRIDSEATWKKLCLPSWVSMEAVRDQFKSLTRARFERYVLNRFPAKRHEQMAISTAKINACRKRVAKIDYGSFFGVGVDGAVSGDTLAVCCYQEQDGVDVFEEFAWEEPDPDTGCYDFMAVADVLDVLYRKPGRPQIGVDPARMILLMKFIERERDVEAFVLKQQPSVMCPACALLKHSIESKAAALGGTPVLAAHAANCILEENKAYGFRFTSTGSGNSKKKIDMAIAASMAMYVYKNTEPRPDYLNAQFVF